jgi:hypothetical protein
MSDGTRRVRIVTDHDSPDAASRIAAAVRPDNTDEMTTTVEGSTVETTIERPTTGGLRSTADDYVVNLRVAAQLDDQDGDPSTDTHDT